MAVKLALTAGALSSEVTAADQTKGLAILDWYAVAKEIPADLPNQEKLDAIVQAIAQDVKATARNAFRQNAKQQVEIDVANNVEW
jgi:hypothetical protein